SLPVPTIPTADQWSLEKSDHHHADELVSSSNSAEPTIPGSNNWAIGGELTADGRAILASDMHLFLRVPAIWYPAVMITPAAAGGRPPAAVEENNVRLVGLTLPGTPALVAGSNGSVAWGFTNSMGDFGDLVELQPLDDDPDQYLTADGPKTIDNVTHAVHIKGQPPLTVESQWTIWGPITIVEPTAAGPPRRFAHHWVGHDVNATNFDLMNLEGAKFVDTAIEIANGCGMSHNNFVCADADGQVGWTIAGQIPKRSGLPARTPIDSSAKNIQWNGYLTPDECPRIVRPVNHRIWTANARVVGGQALEKIGGEYVLGARARQIRDRLLAKEQFGEHDLLEIQLDDEAILMQRWRDLLVEVSSQTESVVSNQFVEQVKKWNGHAAINSVGYRIIRGFRRAVIDDLDASLTAAAQLDRTNLSPFWGLQREGFVWQLVTQRPEHLLPRTDSWNEYLAAHASQVESKLTAEVDLALATWGQQNESAIQHPFSLAMPMLSGWLDMPAVPLPGDSCLPRVQGRSFGASNRLVVSPGHEEDGLLHLPGGQSDHPRSPYYRRGFDDWAEGNPSPLMPGPAHHRLVLKPQ
ncbi:MAG: penicillin acylase family protein, partial [Aeoliella sp.]